MRPIRTFSRLPWRTRTWLEHGADVRVIQEILGHARLTTTQLYTRVSLRLLKAVHTATHPAATLRRRTLTLPKGVTVTYGYADGARPRSAHRGYRR